MCQGFNSCKKKSEDNSKIPGNLFHAHAHAHAIFISTTTKPLPDSAANTDFGVLLSICIVQLGNEVAAAILPGKVGLGARHLGIVVEIKIA